MGAAVGAASETLLDCLCLLEYLVRHHLIHTCLATASPLLACILPFQVLHPVA